VHILVRAYTRKISHTAMSLCKVLHVYICKCIHMYMYITHVYVYKVCYIFACTCIHYIDLHIYVYIKHIAHEKSVLNTHKRECKINTEAMENTQMYVRIL